MDMYSPLPLLSSRFKRREEAKEANYYENGYDAGPSCVNEKPNDTTNPSRKQNRPLPMLPTIDTTLLPPPPPRHKHLSPPTTPLSPQSPSSPASPLPVTPTATGWVATMFHQLQARTGTRDVEKAEYEPEQGDYFQYPGHKGYCKVVVDSGDGEVGLAK
jgi:hypothetical protein